MTEPRFETTVAIQIPFHDIDVMEVVWHGHYVKYFEIARCAVLSGIDYDYPQMRSSGYAWPVIDLNIRYIQSARFGQIVNVNAKIVEWENRLKFNYLITDQTTGARLAKGYTVQVAVNMATQSLCLESPKILLQKLELL